MEKGTKSRIIGKYIIILLLVLFYALFITLRFNPVFVRIDDIKMRWIISGAYTGEPSAYSLFIKYPFAYMIMCLYKWFPLIPWYGFAFIIIHTFCLFVIICKVIEMFSLDKMVQIILCGLLIVLVFSFFNIENMVLLEYTALSALTGGTAIFLLIIDGSGKKAKLVNYLYSIILLILCYNLRLSVFKMTFIFIIIIFCTKLVIEKHALKTFYSFFCENKVFFVYLVVGICCLGGIKLINDAAYSSKDWDEFLKYNSHRSAIFDYDALPDYWENIEYYESMGITEEIYYSILDYNIGFPETVSIDTINTLYEKSEEIKKKTSIKEGLLRAYGALFDDNYAVSSSILIVMTILNLVLLFWNKMVRLFTGYIISIGCILLEYLYVGIGGRFPDRVIVALVLIWACINWGYFLLFFRVVGLKWKNCQHIIIARKIESVLLLFGMVFTLVAVLMLKYNFVSIKRYESVSKLTEMQPIKEYMDNNKDNFYFITTHILSRNYLEAWNEKPTYCNFHELGGWEMFSPCYYEKMQQEGIKYIEDALLENNVYLITDEMYAVEYMLQYYNEKYEENIVTSIDHTIDNGRVEYCVVKFHKDLRGRLEYE